MFGLNRTFLIIALTGFTCVQALVIWNLIRLGPRRFHAKNSSIGTPSSDSATLKQLQREAKSRAALYDKLIQEKMLKSGMVINRSRDGKMIDACDSLLFSAIRYRSLVALGMDASADQALQALHRTHEGGTWWRHPSCKTQSLSRDMFMGVMLIIETSPPNVQSLLQYLLGEIDRGNGKFSDGPFYVSYLSPGPAGILRGLSELNSIPFNDLPWVVKQSFSSGEFDAPFLEPGYQSHLAGLGLWLELQIHSRLAGFNPRSFFGEVERLVTRQLKMVHFE